MQIQLEIPEMYQGLDLAEVQTHLQKELNFYLAEKFGAILGRSMTNTELQQISQDAKQRAWNKYKGQFLAGLDTK
ncbi:MAG: hypothetical protein MUE85_23890 [Microscillaceae bacterium]|jgi:hypothetical protein|nr:hypothetical protein [Microscillaceae bacterium]